jgi:hypothetical protein
MSPTSTMAQRQHLPDWNEDRDESRLSTVGSDPPTVGTGFPAENNESDLQEDRSSLAPLFMGIVAILVVMALIAWWWSNTGGV